MVKGGWASFGWSVISIIVSGRYTMSGVSLLSKRDPGDSVLVGGSRVQYSSNLAAVACLMVFVEESSHRIKDLDLVNP
jgi:hypothetical protein